MNATLRDPAWWSWQPSGGGVQNRASFAGPRSRILFVREGLARVLVGNPLNCRPKAPWATGGPYIWPVCQHLAVWQVFTLVHRPTDWPNPKAGAPWPRLREQQPSTWWAHKAYEAKTSSRSQSLPALLCICPETRAFGKRVSGLLIWREGVPKKAEPDSQPLLPMREKVSPGLQPYPNGPHADSHCESAIDLIFGSLPNSKCSTC